jgi:nitrate/nitrite transporter NarK
LVPAWVTGAASGVANAIWQVGSILAPMAVGAVFAATGSFAAAFITLAAGPALGMVVMFFVREGRPDAPIQTISPEEEQS